MNEKVVYITQILQMKELLIGARQLNTQEVPKVRDQPPFRLTGLDINAAARL